MELYTLVFVTFVGLMAQIPGRSWKHGCCLWLRRQQQSPLEAGVLLHHGVPRISLFYLRVGP